MRLEEIFDLNNEWIKKYLSLINERKADILNKKEQYCEKHHIICKFLSKQKKEKIDNSEENLVNLTFKEHVMCHWYLFKYYESINDTINFEKCIFTLHRMLNIPSTDKFLSKEIKDIDFNVLREYKENYSQIMKNKKILLGKIQVYDKNGEVKYINPEELEQFVNLGYVTRQDYFKNKVQKYYDVIKDEIKNNANVTIPRLYCLIQQQFPNVEYKSQSLFKLFKNLFEDFNEFSRMKEERYYPSIDLSSEDVKFWKQNNIFEIRKKYDYPIQTIAKFKKNVLREKVNYDGTRELNDEDIEYLRSHSVLESVTRFNFTYKEICEMRMELKIKRENKRKIKKTRTKSQIMLDHHQNDVLMINLNTKVKKWIPLENVNEYLSNNYMKYNEYLVNLYHEMMTDVLNYGYEYMVQKYNYKGKNHSFMVLIKKYFSNESESIDKINVILFGKHKKKQFTNAEKEYMKSHTFEECVQHLREHNPKIIRNRMLKKHLIVPSIIYSNEEQDEILRTNSIEDAMEKLNWSRQKVMKRRYALGILQNKRIRFTKEEDDIIKNNTVANAVKLTGRTQDSVKRRRRVLNGAL